MILQLSSDLATVIFAWNGGTGGTGITAAGGTDTTIGSKTYSTLPAGYYLMIAGGPLYVSANTGYYRVKITGTKEDGTSFYLTTRVAVSNSQNNASSAVGVACYHLPYTLSNATITFCLGAQSGGGTAYAIAYRTKFCAVLHVSHNSVESYTV